MRESQNGHRVNVQWPRREAVEIGRVRAAIVERAEPDDNEGRAGPESRRYRGGTAIDSGRLAWLVPAQRATEENQAASCPSRSASRGHDTLHPPFPFIATAYLLPMSQPADTRRE